MWEWREDASVGLSVYDCYVVGRRDVFNNREGASYTMEIGCGVVVAYFCMRRVCLYAVALFFVSHLAEEFHAA